MNHPDFDQDSVNKINIFLTIILLVHTIYIQCTGMLILVDISSF